MMDSAIVVYMRTTSNDRPRFRRLNTDFGIAFYFARPNLLIDDEVTDYGVRSVEDDQPDIVGSQ